MQLFVKIKDLWAEDETAMRLEYSAVGFLWFALFFFAKGDVTAEGVELMGIDGLCVAVGADVFGGLTGDEIGYGYLYDYHEVIEGRLA